MSVHNCGKQMFLDSGEDDDEPIIFKRTNSSFKQNQLNSTSRKLPSQNGDGSATKQPSSSLHVSKNASLGSLKDKAASSSKISAEKPKALSLSASDFVHDNAKGSSSQKLVSSCQRKASHSSKSFSVGENSAVSDDTLPLSFILKETDDIRPLSYKLNASTKGHNSTVFQKVPKQSMASGLANNYTGKTTEDKLNLKARSPDDSDDERPLSYRLNASTKGNFSTAVQKVVPKQSMGSGLANNSAEQTTEDELNLKTRSPVYSYDERPLSYKLNASTKGNNSTSVQKVVPKQSMGSGLANNSAEQTTKGNNSSSVQKVVPKQSMGSGLANKSAEHTTEDELNLKARSPVYSYDERPLSYKLNASTKGNTSTSVQKLVPKLSMGSGLANNSAEQTTVDKLNWKPARFDDSDDDDDNVPLSAKFSSASLASLTNNSLLFRKASLKEFSDDSEDEKPLLSRLQAKFDGATSIKSNSDIKYPPSKIVANGYVKKESIDGLKYSTGSSKRPICETNNSTETSNKKAKVLESSASIKVKHEVVAKKEQMDDDHIPIAQKIKNQVSLGNSVSMKKEIKKTTSFKKDGKKMKTQTDSKYFKLSKGPPGSDGGLKWTTLVHSGVIFPPPYKPHGIKMLYNGQPVDLTPEQEEVATMFAVMKDTDFAAKPKFIENFMNDWRPILGKNHVIKKFELCDFTPIYEWHLREKDKKKQMTSEEKKKLKDDKMMQEEKYMWAIVDGVKEKVGNFRVEPPGLFRGRGEHPKMGKLKRRIRPRDITINIGKGTPIPECPVPGERWKEVKHDNTVTWLAYWNDPINSKESKYVFLAASSALKGQSDREKYEKARMLKKYIQNIRANYTKDFTSKDGTRRQIAVATYLIDKLALRAGNEKDDDEADTVGCCTLKVENVTLLPPNNLQFDFLGKDSIRYFNTVEVELAVYKAIGEFQTVARRNDGRKKGEGDDLFDLLDTSKLNAHLKELMPGLTAKVFRTYNASITLDDMLNKESNDGNVVEKVAVYQIANKEVAIICNHQRTVSKSHDAQMSRLDEKINELKGQRKELEVDLSKAKRGKPLGRDADGKLKKNAAPELLKKRIAQLDDKIEKMELSKKTKEDLKTVALGTSKINYLDPRISVAWCKRNEVPIEKIFNKSLLSKFSWAMDVDPEYRF